MKVSKVATEIRDRLALMPIPMMAKAMESSIDRDDAILKIKELKAPWTISVMLPAQLKEGEWSESSISTFSVCKELLPAVVITNVACGYIFVKYPREFKVLVRGSCNSGYTFMATSLEDVEYHEVPFCTTEVTSKAEA